MAMFTKACSHSILIQHNVEKGKQGSDMRKTTSISLGYVLFEDILFEGRLRYVSATVLRPAALFVARYPEKLLETTIVLDSTLNDVTNDSNQDLADDS